MSTTTGHMDLQSAIQSLQQSINVEAGADGGALEVNDRSAFVPNAATLVKAAQTAATNDSKKAENSSASQFSRGQDMSAEKKKMEQAFVYAQRINPNGNAGPYLAFARLLRNEFAKLEGDAEHLHTGEEKEDNQTATKEGEKGDDSYELTEQETDLSSYSPDMQKLLQLAMKQSKSVTEQFNFLSYALANAEVDISSGASQEANAQEQLDKLKGKTDPQSRKKAARIEKLLVAIRADLKRSRELKTQLQSLLTAMQQKDGRRIQDGYNLTPKAHFVMASMKSDGKESNVSATDLANNYRDEVLNMKNPSQFFDNFMLKHNALGFRKYLELILRLFGDDISSANPSRGMSQLKSIRDGLFFAEMCNQVYENMMSTDQKLEHILLMRQREAGIYQVRTLIIEYGSEKLGLFIVFGEEAPKFIQEVRFHRTTDHFGAITKAVDRNHVDVLHFKSYHPDDNETKMFRRALQRRYGLEVRLAKIKKPTELVVENVEAEKS